MKKSGSLRGDIIYNDLSGHEKPLISRQFLITGKPDIIIKLRKGFVPVEYKSSEREKPELGHILQLGAYFIIIEENYGHVPFGYLEYRNKSFKIKNDEGIKSMVLQRVSEIRENTYPHRNHSSSGKCAKCPYRSICELALV